MKKIVLILLTIIITAAPMSVSAAEISPEPGTYTFGSTSEFSEPASVPGPDVSGSDALADTGESQVAIYIASGLLFTLALGLLYVVRQKRLAKH